MERNTKGVISALHDFKKVEIPDVLLNVKVDYDIVRERLNDFAERSATIIAPEDAIQTGDYVLVNVDGEEGQAAIGTGYYDEVIEKALLGHFKGDKLTVDGKQIEVLSVKRRIIPEPTEEQVEALGLKNVHTFPEYLAHLEEEVKEEAMSDRGMTIFGKVCREMIKNSDFPEPDHGDPVYDMFWNWECPDPDYVPTEREAKAFRKEALDFTQQTYLGMVFAEQDGLPPFDMDRVEYDYRKMAEEEGMEYEAYMKEMMGGMDFGEEEVAFCYIRYFHAKVMEWIEPKLRVTVVNKQ